MKVVSLLDNPEVKQLSSFCGIYFLIHNDDIVYIGQSIDIPNRIRQHKGHYPFDTVKYIEVNKNKLNKIEKEYILQYTPKYNKTYLHKNGNSKSLCSWFLKYNLYAKSNIDNIYRKELYKKYSYRNYINSGFIEYFVKYENPYVISKIPYTRMHISRVNKLIDLLSNNYLIFNSRYDIKTKKEIYISRPAINEAYEK